MFKFDSIGIPNGSVLCYIKDSDIECVVVSPSRVSYKNKTYSVSGLTLFLLRSAGSRRKSVQGTKFWTFRGKKLIDLAEQKNDR